MKSSGWPFRDPEMVALISCHDIGKCYVPSHRPEDRLACYLLQALQPIFFSLPPLRGTWLPGFLLRVITVINRDLVYLRTKCGLRHRSILRLKAVISKRRARSVLRQRPG